MYPLEDTRVLMMMLPKNILLVEDNSHIRLAMATYLKLKGMQVVEAESCAKAKAALEAGAGQIDVVITDINLPDGKGDELLTLASLPVIAMTGHVDDATRERLLASGFAGFLPKPATFDQVMLAIEEATA